MPETEVFGCLNLKDLFPAVDKLWITFGNQVDNREMCG